MEEDGGVQFWRLTLLSFGYRGSINFGLRYNVLHFHQLVLTNCGKLLMSGNEHLLADLLDTLTPAIRSKARNFSTCVPSVTQGEFEGLLRESVWKACRNGSLSNFDPHRGHVMPRIYHYWRFALIDAARKAQKRQTVSLDTMPTCPPAMTEQPEDMVSLTQELQRFRRLRPMDYAVISALIDGADTKEFARLFGRSEYDGYARMRVSRARKALGNMLCG